MRIAAFFDIDGTVLSCNSARLFAQHLQRKGLVRRIEVLVVAYHLARYRLGLLSPAEILRPAMSFVVGRPERWMIEMCDAWYREEVRPHIHDRMRELVEEHRSDGHLPVLLSSTTCYLGDPLGRELDIEHRLVNRLLLDGDGNFTGRLAEPLCFGHGKVIHAERFAERHGVDLSRSFFYTDSITDLAALELVGEPRIVNPDPRLRRVAKQRGWPVLELPVPAATRGGRSASAP